MGDQIAPGMWQRIGDDLDTHGCAVVQNLLSAEECRDLTALYAQDGLFRSRVIMAQHGFGRGEYKYFAHPLPMLVATLRKSLYPPLARIANRWNANLGVRADYPPNHEALLELCRVRAQTKPTPLMLSYREGDYNCLHQDVYGDLVFPLQVTVLLSLPGREFTGGEFVLTEQRPRMQSRAEVVALGQGDAVIFPVRQRPVRSLRSSRPRPSAAPHAYRVNLRHGVSRVRSGLRYTLGIIFHDAK